MHSANQAFPYKVLWLLEFAAYTFFEWKPCTPANGIGSKIAESCAVAIYPARSLLAMSGIPRLLFSLKAGWNLVQFAQARTPHSAC